MISLRAITLAIGNSFAARHREEQERLAYHRRKAEEQAERDARWREELARRQMAELDLDGSRAAARAERERELEEQRLAEMTAMLIRQTR